MSDFNYAGFDLTVDDLNAYTTNATTFKKTPHEYNTAMLLSESIIECIAANNVKFDPKNAAVCDALERMIRECGRDEYGCYNQTAHDAMANLYRMRGLDPTSYSLVDKKYITLGGIIRGTAGLFGRGARATKRIGGAIAGATKSALSFFGRYKYQIATTAAVGTAAFFIGRGQAAPSNTTSEPTNVAKTVVQPTITTANSQTTYDLAQNDSVFKKFAYVAPQKTTPKFNTVTFQDTTSRVVTDQKPTIVKKFKFNPFARIKAAFKSIKTHVTNKTHVQTAPVATKSEHDVFNKFAFKPAQQFTPQFEFKSTHKPTDYEIALDKYYDSALDILIGTRARDALYNKIQTQVNHGIFKLESGISAKRVAHALIMSRVYEHNNTIENALNATQALNTVAQANLTQHILNMGAQGEKIQHRATHGKHFKHKHSRFSRASHAKQTTHIKNLKQLRQLRGIHR